MLNGPVLPRCFRYRVLGKRGSDGRVLDPIDRGMLWFCDQGFMTWMEADYLSVVVAIAFPA